MSLVFYLKLYNNLTNTKSLSISKKNHLKSFIYSEYKLSKIKKQKLKIGQLRFHYNPIILDSNLTVPHFELKSANTTPSSKSLIGKKSISTRVVVGILTFLGVVILLKYLTQVYNLYFLNTSFEELNDFLLDTIFQIDEQSYFFDTSIKKSLKNLLF